MDNRKFRRIDVNFSGFLQLESESIAIQVLNLSKGGACLTLNRAEFEKIAAMRHLRGSFRYKNDDIPFNCQICWTSESTHSLSLGVEFTTKPPPLAKVILNLMPAPEPDFQEGSFHI